MSTPLFNFLETERLQLREITPDVFKEIFESSLSDNALMSLFGFNTKEELSEQREKYEKGMTTFNRSFLYFHLIEKTTGQNIGWCGFHTWYLQHRRAELGYGLTVEEKKGKGIMSEAIKPIVDHGFKVMNLHRIEAFASPANIPSIKLLKNLGFVEEGLMREHYFKNEVFENSAVFSLLEGDYITS